MADEKTFSESEHIAILTDRVQTETAQLSTRVSELETEKADLQGKLDVAESAKVAAEQRAETAEADLATYKADIELLAEQASKRDERLTQVKEAAAHLGDDFFADEQRVARIVAYSDEGFEGYLADLKATAPAGTPAPVVPRETAMAGDPATPTPPSAGRGFLLGRFTKEG